MSWLLRDGDVLATAEVAEGFAQRSKGLLGRKGYEGAMVLPHTRSVHTMGMRFPVDVAFCDKDMVVVGVTRLAAVADEPAPEAGTLGHRGRSRCVRALGPPHR